MIGQNLVIIGKATTPPPPPINAFKPIFHKDLEELVLATDSGLKSEKVAKSLLDGSTLDEDLNVYKNHRTSKMLARQDTVFYKVWYLANDLYFLFKLCDCLT